MFRRLDQNGDGLLGPDEMTDGLRGQRARWDRNRDGSIDAGEYGAFFQSHHETVAVAVAAGEIPIKLPKGMTLAGPPAAEDRGAAAPPGPASAAGPARVVRRVRRGRRRPGRAVRVAEEGSADQGLRPDGPQRRTATSRRRSCCSSWPSNPATDRPTPRRPARRRPLESAPGYRSISPMTMSMLPTMAGTSAIRQPRQISSGHAQVAEAARPRPHPQRHRSPSPAGRRRGSPSAPAGTPSRRSTRPAGRCRGGSTRCEYFVFISLGELRVLGLLASSARQRRPASPRTRPSPARPRRAAHRTCPAPARRS